MSCLVIDDDRRVAAFDSERTAWEFARYQPNPRVWRVVGERCYPNAPPENESEADDA